MFSLALDYQTGIMIHAGIVIIIYLVWLIHMAYVAGYNFIHDKIRHDKKNIYAPTPWGLEKNPDVDDIVLGTVVLGGILSTAACFVWPLIWPVLLITAGLFSARNHLRLQKKVDAATKS